MTNIEAVRKWLRTYESLSSGRLGVDFLPEKAQTYSVDSVPGPEIVKRYLDGSAVKQFDFVLASREFFGDFRLGSATEPTAEAFAGADAGQTGAESGSDYQRIPLSDDF